MSWVVSLPRRPRALLALVVALLALTGMTGLAVRGSGGASVASAQTVLQVSAGGPYAGTAGFPVAMSASVSGAVNPQFTWNFGDGTVGSGQVTSHSYAAAGVYPVTVTVTDLATGQSAVASTTATITGATACVNGVFVSSLNGCTPVVTCVSGVVTFVTTGCAPVLTCVNGLSLGCAPVVTCVTTLGIGCTTLAPSIALGCTSGVAPCAVGETCTPVSSNQVFCTTAATTTTTTTAAATTSTTSVSAPPPTVDNCGPYDSSCVYCANHPSASVCKPQ